MELYGKKWSVVELRRRVGSMDQVAGIKPVQLDDGNERPARAFLLHTAAGLEAVIIADRGLDIAAARYRGRPMGWRSVTGDVAPQYFEPEGFRWLRGYFGGLLTTCGLSNVGLPASDSALSGKGLHGRVSNTPARNLCVRQGWENRDYVLRIEGEIREASVFGENLVLRRRITAWADRADLLVEDTLVNEGFRETPYMLLYHCNIGWPALDEGSRLVAPSRKVVPRDAEAEKGLDAWHAMTGPRRGWKEQVFFHDMAPDRAGWVTTALLNAACSGGPGDPFGVVVRYRADTLPRFTQWKMTGEQEYVCGLEPCTCGVGGIEAELREGTAKRLRPGASLRFTVAFSAVDSVEAARALETRIRAVPGR
ncbi:MAG TPA: aldose 1-epimerase family protein [Candidatus Hydrogenedentes bacterium]|nr:aldose 1-epimerase family protein [Candidatus Hydrogenedentota bacterium]